MEVAGLQGAQSVSQSVPTPTTEHRLTRSRPSPDERVVLPSRDEGDAGAPSYDILMATHGRLEAGGLIAAWAASGLTPSHSSPTSHFGGARCALLRLAPTLLVCRSLTRGQVRTYLLHTYYLLTASLLCRSLNRGQVRTHWLPMHPFMTIWLAAPLHDVLNAHELLLIGHVRAHRVTTAI